MFSKNRICKNKEENNKAYYDAKRDDILVDRKENYDSEKRSEHHADDYNNHLLASYKKSLKSSKACYHKGIKKSHE